MNKLMSRALPVFLLLSLGLIMVPIMAAESASGRSGGSSAGHTPTTGVTQQRGPEITPTLPQAETRALQGDPEESVVSQQSKEQEREQQREHTRHKKSIQVEKQTKEKPMEQTNEQRGDQEFEAQERDRDRDQDRDQYKVQNKEQDMDQDKDKE